MKKIALFLALFLLAGAALASTRLMKLSEDRYLLTHQKQTMLGGQGKALRLNYEKAGSLCEILGYSWFEITDNQSKGRTFGSGAASTLELKFYKSKAKEDLFDCKELATEAQKQKMRKALDKID